MNWQLWEQKKMSHHFSDMGRCVRFLSVSKMPEIKRTLQRREVCFGSVPEPPDCSWLLCSFPVCGKVDYADGEQVAGHCYPANDGWEVEEQSWKRPSFQHHARTHCRELSFLSLSTSSTISQQPCAENWAVATWVLWGWHHSDQMTARGTTDAELCSVK